MDEFTPEELPEGHIPLELFEGMGRTTDSMDCRDLVFLLSKKVHNFGELVKKAISLDNTESKVYLKGEVKPWTPPHPWVKIFKNES